MYSHAIYFQHHWVIFVHVSHLLQKGGHTLGAGLTDDTNEEGRSKNPGSTLTPPTTLGTLGKAQ